MDEWLVHKYFHRSSEQTDSNHKTGGITGHTLDGGSRIVADSSVSTSSDASTEETVTDATKKYTEEELNALTVAQIKAIAAERGYDTKETVKAKIIAEFLTQQG